MNSGLYAACAGLMSRMQALDTIASNVANSDSSGFRAQTEAFGTVLAQAGSGHKQLSTLNRATNSFSQSGRAVLDESQGSISHTDNALDFALEGPGFFKVQTRSGTAYTRNGHFQVDASGQLVTEAGDKVLGEGGPVLLTGKQVSVSADGTISSNGSLVGRLTIVQFPSTTEISSRGAGLYTAPEKAEMQTAETMVRQGALEGSNVSPMDGMVQLISAQRAAESMRHVLSMIDGEMDKTAVQELAHVG